MASVGKPLQEIRGHENKIGKRQRKRLGSLRRRKREIRDKVLEFRLQRESEGQFLRRKKKENIQEVFLLTDLWTLVAS